MKNLIRFGMVALAFALAATGEARIGGKSQKLMFASEGTFEHDNSTTASLFVSSTRNRGHWEDGEVIILEAAGTIAVDSTPNMVFGVSVGGTLMISSGNVAVTAGKFRVRAVGIVRSLSTSSAVGSIHWTLNVQTDQASDTTTIIVDTSADDLDTRTVRTQEVALSFDWGTAHTDNDLDVDSFTEFSF